MKKPHKHAEFIHAWADGNEIEFQLNNDTDLWVPLISPSPIWNVRNRYRIKPSIKDTQKAKTEESGLDLGDTVYFISHCRLKQKTVREKRSFLNGNGMISTIYKVFGYTEEFLRKELFSTAEDAIKGLAEQTLSVFNDETT